MDFPLLWTASLTGEWHSSSRDGRRGPTEVAQRQPPDKTPCTVCSCYMMTLGSAESPIGRSHGVRHKLRFQPFRAHCETP